MRWMQAALALGMGAALFAACGGDDATNASGSLDGGLDGEGIPSDGAP